MLVGQVVVDPVVHPARGLAQSLGVHRLAVATTVAGGLAEDELLGLGDLQRGGAGGGLLGGVDDDADLGLGDAAGGEGVAGRVVLLLQQPGDSQPARVHLAGVAGELDRPGVRAARCGAERGLATVGFREHGAAERGGLGLDPGGGGEQVAEQLLGNGGDIDGAEVELAQRVERGAGLRASIHRRVRTHVRILHLGSDRRQR